MPESENRTYAEALWDHITMDPEELRFRHGDLIEIIDMNDKDWWYGALDDHQEGWLPATFVRVCMFYENFTYFNVYLYIKRALDSITYYTSYK